MEEVRIFHDDLVKLNDDWESLYDDYVLVRVTCDLQDDVAMMVCALFHHCVVRDSVLYQWRGHQQDHLLELVKD